MSARAARARARAPVALGVRDGVARIVLERAETGNALDEALSTALAEACAAVAEDDGVRAVVLAARGADFSVGLPAERAWPDAAWPDAIAAVAAIAKPVVAAVAGEARGWGFSLALACDVRVAATSAVFSLPEAARGRLPGGGATQRLARMVGTARATELALLGTRLRAARAAAWGLVSTVVAPARLAGAAERTARTLAARAPLALRLGKEAVLRALDLPLDDGIRLEHDLYVLLQTTADRRAGIEAFLARRPPGFRGR